MRRCFIALNLAPPARENLCGLLEQLERLPRSAARRLRLVKPLNLHLTLKFLGDTTEAQLPQLTATLAELAARMTSPRATVAGRGAFPSPTRPRVLFAGLADGRDAATALARDLDRACTELGFPAESREPTPHVTLARVEGAAAHGPLTAWLAEPDPEPYGALDESGLVLFESQLTAAGAVYHPLASLPWGAP